MNSLIRDELLLILNVFGHYKGEDQITIISICSKLLDSEEYVSKVYEKLDDELKQPNFDVTTDFINLIVSIIDVNKCVEFYKKLKVDTMKICIYGLLYSYILKNNSDVLNKLEIHKLRILYFNTIQVLLVQPKTIEIAKEGLLSAIGRCIGIDWLVGKRILI